MSVKSSSQSGREEVIRNFLNPRKSFGQPYEWSPERQNHDRRADGFFFEVFFWVQARSSTSKLDGDGGRAFVPLCWASVASFVITMKGAGAGRGAM